ncbi:MAG TPA: glycosyltransferase family 39 protein, partial [Acidobacteriaceae bacterium]
SATLRVSCALAAGLACAVLLPLLGHRSLAMWDEGIYAEIAREMLHGSALVPTWNYRPWFEKPPLLFWITALFFRVFGVTEFWARAASALSGVATVALLHRFVARRFGLLAAWIGSLLLLSTFEYLHVCRVGEMDALLALGETIAVVGLVLVSERRSAGWLLFWLGFASALMTKGAASVVLPVTLVCVAVVERWPLARYGRMFFAGVAIFLAAVLPWHIAMGQRFGASFTAEYLGLHVLERASSQIEGHHTHAWYYLLALLVSAPPWVLLYPTSVVAAFRTPELRALRIFAIFALAVLLFFTVVQTRMPHYIAPVYPALSVITGVVAARWLQRIGTRTRAALLTAAAGVWGVTAVLTAHARKELRTPGVSNGVVAPDSHEAATLLQRALPAQRPQGPLLLWAEPPLAPITTALFYSRGPVQQVELSPPNPQPEIYKYTWNPVPLEAQAGPEPRLLFVERPLLATLPADLTFSPIASSPHWVLGTVARRP